MPKFIDFPTPPSVKQASRQRLTWTKSAGAEGLYGYTKSVQRLAEAATRKLARHALKVAKQAFTKDAEVVPFLQAHMRREDSKPARVLLAAMKEIGPKLASQMQGGVPLRTAGAPEYGLYGFKARTADLGLEACKDVRATAGRITADLHQRKGDLHPKITGFYKTHAEQTKCAYAGMLFSCYPDPTRTASVKEAGGGAGVTVFLSGKSREWKLPEHRHINDEGYLKVNPQEAKVTGTAKVSNLGIASYEEFAFVREPGHLEDIELNPSEWKVFAGSAIEMATSNGFDPEDVSFTIFFSEVEDAHLSGGFTRHPAPSDFDVEGTATVVATWGNISQLEEEVGFTANFSTSTSFREAWDSLGSAEWDEEVQGPRRFAHLQPLTGGWLEWDQD